MFRLSLCTLCLTCFLFAPSLQADVVGPSKSNGDFIPGTGIPGDNFVSDTAGTGEQVFLKARSRDTGQALSQVGNRYYVEAGLASNNSSPWWSFDFQFSPGETGQNPEDYTLDLWVDFDPGVGATDFVMLSAPVGDADADPSNSWDDGDGWHLNPGGAAWSTDNVPWVAANSWHLGFGFWGKSYDPNATGEYELRLTVSDAGGVVASTTAFANVVPEPSSFAFLCALTLMVGRRRRR